MHRERIPPSLSTLPRLITVAEIIKREYLKLLAAKGSSRRLGLYQYNQLRILERNDGGNARVDTGVNERRDDEMDVISELDDDLERAKSIVKALEGKHLYVSHFSLRCDVISMMHLILIAQNESKCHTCE